MKILMISIGKNHEPNYKDAIEDFTNRLNKYYPTEWLLIPTPKNAAVLNEVDLKKAEATSTLNKLSKDDYLVLMDERGKQLSSTEMASFIEQRGNESCKKIVFLIGGAFGVDDRIKNRANYTCSFSKMVFPHQIFRLLIAEQLYRACTIINNEKYHHI